jgi:hypothetical protein
LYGKSLLAPRQSADSDGARDRRNSQMDDRMCAFARASAKLGRDIGLRQKSRSPMTLE